MKNRESHPNMTYIETDLAKDLLSPGASLFVLERHSSRSGGTLYLQVLAASKGKVSNISWLCAKIINDKKWRYNPDRKALKISTLVHGGTDFAFELADDLSAALRHGEDRLQPVWL